MATFFVTSTAGFLLDTSGISDFTKETPIIWWNVLAKILIGIIYQYIRQHSLNLFKTTTLRRRKLQHFFRWIIQSYWNTFCNKVKLQNLCPKFNTIYVLCINFQIQFLFSLQISWQMLISWFEWNNLMTFEKVPSSEHWIINQGFTFTLKAVFSPETGLQFRTMELQNKLILTKSTESLKN